MARIETKSIRRSVLCALAAAVAFVGISIPASAQEEGKTEIKTGIQKRSFARESGQGDAPQRRGRGRGGGYGLYVPHSYDGAKATPFILALPSATTSNEDFLTGDDEALVKLAESRGYLVATSGSARTSRGMWTKSESETIQRAARADEANVMRVLAQVKEEFNVDEDRVYILGHSSGAAAAMFLGSKHPEHWAAAAAIAGSWGDEASLKSMKDVPVITVIGDGDYAISIESMRKLSAAMDAVGIAHAHQKIEGANKESVLALALPKVFDFFDQHKRK